MTVEGVKEVLVHADGCLRSRCAQWARRHDKDQDQALNYVAPSIRELEEELQRLKASFEGLEKYKE